MRNSKIINIDRGHESYDGAGVKLRRIFGFNDTNRYDPFLLMDHFGSDDPDDYMPGFPFHPHRGIETLTYLKKGSIEHQDKLGNCEIVESGGIQWMTTGRGIYHQEMPKDLNGLNGFQLWINLPANRKMIDATYKTFSKLPKSSTETVSTTIISGIFNNISGPATGISSQDIDYFDVEFNKADKWEYKISNKLFSFIYVYQGSILIGEDVLHKGEVGILENNGQVEVFAENNNSSFLFIAGKPIKEPVAWWGPVVMNTQEEISAVKEELRLGKFPG